MADVHSLNPNIHIEGNLNKWIKKSVLTSESAQCVISLSHLMEKRLKIENPFSSGDDTRHVRNGKWNKLKKNGIIYRIMWLWLAGPHTAVKWKMRRNFAGNSESYRYTRDIKKRDLVLWVLNRHTCWVTICSEFYGMHDAAIFSTQQQSLSLRNSIKLNKEKENF